MAFASFASPSRKGGKSKGKSETIILRATINDQLNRLFTQLEDLEELKDELEPGEYEEEKQETLDQLKEFQLFLEKSVAGDMSLSNEFDKAQMAIQAAVSEAFKTPEVIRMFANAQPDQLRKRLAILDRDRKLKVLTEDAYKSQAVEVLVALKKMGTELTTDEAEFLENMSSSRLLESAVDSLGAGTQQNLMTTARHHITRAEGERKSSR